MISLRKKRILVIRQLGGIGDVIMLSPVFRGLKETYPDHRIVCVTSAHHQGGALVDLASHNPNVDEVHIIEPAQAVCERTRQVWNQHYANSPRLEDQEFYRRADIQFDMNTPCVDYEWTAQNLPGGIQKPRWEIFCDFAGVKPTSYFPDYEVTKTEWLASLPETIGWKKQKVVGLGLQSIDPKRAITDDAKLLAIAQGLMAQGVTVVTVDGIKKLPNVPYIIGKRLRDLIPIVAAMDAFISVDSGLLHVAGMMKVPVIGIFGPTDPLMRMPLYRGSAIDPTAFVPCSPCWYKYPCLKDGDPKEHRKCLTSIDTSIIIEETMRWLKNPSRQTLPVVR